MKLTNEQESAVYAPLSDILVTAAAGSGKTQVLTGRITERIKNGADISRLLIITFTNAAAAEMRERIKKSLTDALISEDDANKRAYLKRQLSRADTADISTLHSFCLKLLKTYFHHIGLDPSFTLLNNYDRRIMLAESLEEAADFFYECKNADFLALSDLVSSQKNDLKLTEMISAVRDFAMSTPFPERWLENAKQMYLGIEKGNAPFSEPLLSRAHSLISEALTCLENAAALLEKEPGLATLYDKTVAEIDAISEFLKKPRSWDGTYEFLSSFKFAAFTGGKKDADPEIKRSASELHNSAKKLVTEHAAPLIDTTYDDAAATTLYMSKYVCVLADAASKALSVYSEKKAEKNVLDFNDLEHFAIKLLTDSENPEKPSALAAEIKNLYDEIYVDEYQDINDIQEAIIGLVSSNKHNVFMVGDMKQSIYRFRHTDPERIFAKKAAEFTDIASRTPEDKKIRISLTANFRSTPEMIADVNTVFKALMSKALGGVAYEGTELLRYENGVYTEKAAMPAMTMKCIAARGKKQGELLSAEADFLAKRIKELISSDLKVYDKKENGYRPIRYGDIAVLMRVTKNRADDFEAALCAYDIPVIYEKELSFFDSREIALLLSLLRVVDNPLQDIDLIAVLRSPFFNFDTDLLTSLALLKKPYFYDAVKCFSEGEDPNGKCLYFMNKLKKWRREASLSGVYDFTSRLISELDYTSYVSSMSESDTHIANLNLFLSFAKKSDSSSYKGLFNFLKYIESLYSSGGIEPDSSAESNANAVRIMTIHKSKGLEFPYVFLPGVAARFNRRASSGDLFLGTETGISINAFYPDRSVISAPTVKLAALREREGSLSEEMRVLYVALTRAREHLEIIASESFSADKTDDEIRGILCPEKKGVILPSELSLASSPFGWLSVCSRETGVPEITVLFSDEENSKEEASEIEALSPLPFGSEIDAALSRRCPKSDLISVKNKYSVSELKSGAAFSDEDAKPFFALEAASLSAPEYLNSDKVFTSRQKGSIMHYIVEHIDFYDSDVASQLERMDLTEKERAAADIPAIEALLSSDMAERLRKSRAFFREVPFTFRKKVSSLTDTVKSDFYTLIQGVIDCYFIEDDGIVLIDYKTDRGISPEKAAERYLPQLELYSEALTKRHGLPVKERYLYMFASGTFIKL